MAMTDNSMEARLASVFATVASQFPEEPATILPVAEQRSPLTSRRRRRVPLGRTGVAALAVLTVGGIGGVAAATNTNWLSPALLAEQAVESGQSEKDLAPALPTGSENPLQVPGAEVHATLPGPESTTLVLTTAESANTADHIGACWSITVRKKDGSLPPSLPHGSTACSLLAGPGPVGPQPDTGFAGSLSSTGFTAPSGTSYNIIWGDEGPSVTTVSLHNNHGVAATIASTKDGWFALYLPRSKFDKLVDLVTYGKSGSVISSTAWGSP